MGYPKTSGDSTQVERGEPLPGLLYEADLEADEDEEDDDDGATRAAAATPPPRSARPAAAGPAAAGPAAAPRPRPARTPEAVKLGLGDFVFYSVLVSNAFASHVAAGAACFVATLLGLGGTFALLAAYRRALPALPLSILAGVFAYAAVEYAAIPVLADLADRGLLV